jgi:hypothetical protein
MKYLSYPWPPLEAALSILNVGLFCCKQLFEKELIKTEAAINAEASAF